MGLDKAVEGLAQIAFVPGWVGGSAISDRPVLDDPI